MATLRAPLLMLAVILLMVPPARAATWYVTQSGTGDATTIQAGIDLAITGDTVLVAPGVYTDTLHVTIQGEQKVANVHLTKEISLIAEGDTTNTIIDGPGSDVAVFVEGVGSMGFIEGFRISTVFAIFLCPAPAPGESDADVQLAALADFKVGVWCEGSAITIQNCVLENHGIAVELYASPVTVRECRIAWVSAGVECYSGSDAVIEGNRWYWVGGGVTSEASSPVIIDNDMGGEGEMCVAVSCTGGGAPYIARNTFRDVIYQTVHIGSCDAMVEGNLFINGAAAIFISAGTHVPIVRNNIFYDHSAWIIETWTSAPVIENNTIDYAPGPDTRGIEVQGGSPLIRNNVISRTSAGISCYGATPTIECNNVYSTTYPYHDECPDQTGINGNISVDPEFCGVWDTVDYRLQSDSPCAPGNHPDGYACGQIGAKGVGCSTTPTKPRSWGAIKALYGGKERK